MIMDKISDDKFLLQNIILPSEDTCEDSLMYYTDNKNVRIYNGYFNVFSIYKWRHYTVLDKLYLRVEAKGKFAVRVCNENGDLRYDSKHQSVPSIDIAIDYNAADKLLWFEFEKLEENTELTAAYYYTKDKPTQDVKIALDICTYKREAYVQRNIDVLSRCILDNPASPLYNMLDIYIIDNGQSLDIASIEREHIRVFPNKNAGGAGGFTRGIIEILKNKASRGYTHMIFLDDDAVQEPDAFIRTAAIMALIKPEYAKASIAGCMLRLDRLYILHEAGALWENGALKQLHQGYDLRKTDEVISNEELYNIDYGAWFYACYPLSVINEKSLPLPIFVHCDDSEYGLRNNNGVIVMNGICVWHDANGNGKSSSMGYYDVRNGLIISALHDRDGGVKQICKNLLKLCISDCWRYRYKDAVLRCRAVEDFLRGPDYIGSLDPIAKNNELSGLGYRYEPVNNLTNDKSLISEMYQIAEDKARKEQLYPQAVNRFDIIKSCITFNGLMLPAKQGIKAADVSTQSYTLFRVRDLILFDHGSMKGFRTKRSLFKTVSCFGFLLKAQIKLIKNYSKIKSIYKRDIYKLINIDFWNKYLELKD